MLRKFFLRGGQNLLRPAGFHGSLALDPLALCYLPAFRKGLNEIGFVEGRNGSNTIGKHLQVFVRDNNVEQALSLRALKKKMQREGVFREMKRRKAYEKPSERRNREKAEAIRRARKAARKQAQREGLHAVPSGAPGRSEFVAQAPADARWAPRTPWW
jgi:small subunit ribosomal protein S21